LKYDEDNFKRIVPEKHYLFTRNR